MNVRVESLTARKCFVNKTALISRKLKTEYRAKILKNLYVDLRTPWKSFAITLVAIKQFN